MKIETAVFDPNPRFENHFCHFRPWAEHYKDAPGEVGILARMLGYAWDEVEILRNRGARKGKAQAELLFAYVGLVDKLCFVCRIKPVPFADETLSIKGAWASIQQLNRWREENKLNIKAVDIV